jgi:hypothetical protein
MNNSLPTAVRHLCARYRTQGDSIRRNSHETHDLRSLSQRLLLSPEETLDQVAAGNLLSLDSRNGKHLFSTRSLDAMRNRVVDFIAGEIVEEMSARGASEDRICFALERAFQKQFDLSRGRGENIVEFARTPNDDDDNTLRNAALLAGGAAAGYGAYRYMKGRNNGNGNTLTGPGAQPLLPPGPSGNSGDVMNPRHPSAPGSSISVPITSQSSTTRKTIGNSVLDPLADAAATGRRTIAKRGSAIWQALRGIPLE